MPNQQLYTTIIEKKSILSAIIVKYNLFRNALIRIEITYLLFIMVENFIEKDALQIVKRPVLNLN